MIWKSLSETELQRKSASFRYAYYVVTSFRLKSFASWRNEGEPNPFVHRAYPSKNTERKEFTNMFRDVLGTRSRVSRPGLD